MSCGCGSPLFGGKCCSGPGQPVTALLPAMAYNTDFAPLTIYNYGKFNTTPSQSAAVNTQALLNMFAAMQGSSGGNTGGMVWIPQYTYPVLVASPSPSAGIIIPDGTIMQGLGAGGAGTAHFAISGTGAGDIFMSASGPHTGAGVRVRDIGFQWMNPLVAGTVNDIALQLNVWNAKAQDCSFVDCPTAVSMGDAQNGLSTTIERCVIRYGLHAHCPDNATAIIMSGEQSQVIGPGEIIQAGITGGGPKNCTAIGWGGGKMGDEHQIVSGYHFASWMWGIDFSNPQNIVGLVGGVQRFSILDNKFDIFGTSIKIASQNSGTVLYGGHIRGNTITKSTQSQNDSNPIVLIDTLPGAGGINNNIAHMSFVDNDIFGNIDSTGSQNGIAADNTYGVEIRGGVDIRFVDGKIGNMGNNGSATRGADGSANVCINATAGGGPGEVEFIGVALGATYIGAQGGGSAGSGPSQWAVLIKGTLTVGPVTFDNCPMPGYLGAIGQGGGPVGVGTAGGVGVGTLYVRNCKGYNDQDVNINGLANLVAGTAYASYNQGLNGGAAYFGPSYVQYNMGVVGATLIINGHTPVPLPANSGGFFWLNSPYDTFSFSIKPIILNWRGR